MQTSDTSAAFMHSYIDRKRNVVYFPAILLICEPTDSNRHCVDVLICINTVKRYILLCGLL